MNTLREELDDLQDRLFRLLSHQEATGQDKASIVLASTSLSAIRERRKGQWPRRAKMVLVLPSRPPDSPEDWLLDWESRQWEART